jgi:nicotinate-nucleotide adenylyltransferase
MTRIALFGTSADPPTIGHLEILRWLSQRFDQVAVWAADNPFKSGQTELSHRTTMLQQLVEELDCPNVRVDPTLSHPRTLITVERAKHCFPQAEFTLVVGFDVARQLPTWFRVEELLKQVHLLVMPRSGYALAQADLDRLRELGTEVAIAPITVPGVSSTAYREHHDLNDVPHSVQAYIDREQLYGCDARPEKQPVH